MKNILSNNNSNSNLFIKRCGIKNENNILGGIFSSCKTLFLPRKKEPPFMKAVFV